MFELKAKIRGNLGKGSKNLRKEGVLPAVVYGYRQKNEALKLDYKEFDKVFSEAGENVLIQLRIGEEARKTVLIRDVQRDPISGRYIHADFYAIREDQPLKVAVPLIFEGEEESVAVRDLGGYLSRYIHEVEVEALPKDLPKELKVNAAGFTTLEDKIFIKDIALPPGVKVLADPDEVVASVEPPISEEELKGLEEKPEEKIEEVEVEEKGKKEEPTEEKPD